MLRFIARRSLFIVAVSVFIVYAANFGMSMTRNSEVLEPNYNLVHYSRQAWQAAEQFFSNLLRGDFGIVQTEYGLVYLKDYLLQSYLNSMGLLLVALALASLIGLTIGAWAALTKRQSVSLSFLTLTTIGISVPSFFAAILLQQWAIRYQQTFGRRLVSVGGYGWDYKHMLLPVLVLAARPLAYLTRAAFIGLGHVMQEDYMRTAYSKGLGQGRAVVFHAFRNTAVPVLTAVGVSLRFSLSSLPVVEAFFGWPGMGTRLLQAINERQTEMVILFAFALGLTLLLVNLLLDIAYRFIDPRIREALEN